MLLTAGFAAQALAASPAPKPAPLALTISGGGTKGAYMAGHLYYMGQLSVLSDAPLVPRVFTGASAGAINALLAAVTSCTSVKADPRESLYWQAWMDIGLDQVFDPHAVGATGVFSNHAYEGVIDRIRGIWQAGLPTDCDVMLGVTITRAYARPVTLARDLPSLPKSREPVLVHITGRGAGQPPQVRNVVDLASPDRQLLLALDGPDADPFGALVQLVLASAAFPVTFAPVNVPHCLSTPHVAPRCAPADASDALFVDGGIFDNQPLGLAARAMHLLGCDADGNHVVLDRCPADAGFVDGARFYFLDPRAHAYPTTDEWRPRAAPRDAVGIVEMLFGMVDSSAASALVSAFQQNPSLRERLIVSRTYYPQISSTFNGLLERAFREFDFYLGMYNAARTVAAHPEGGDMPAVAAVRVASDPALLPAWRPLLCLHAVLDGVGDPASCAGDELRDFRILMQLSLDQLADACRPPSDPAQPLPQTDHPQCAASLAGGPVQRVPGVLDIGDAARRLLPGEAALSYQLRLLGRYGFHFRDLGLTRAQADEASVQLNRIAHRVVQRFADQQPELGWALGALGRVAVDMTLGYQPPQHNVHVLLGLGAEVGYSVTFSDPGWDWLRFTVALGFDGFSTLLNPSDDYFALIPKGGVELELYGAAAAQVRLGLRAGYQLSTADELTAGACDHARESHQPCSRFVTDAYASLSVFSLLRLQLAVAWEPALRDGQRARVSVRPMIGVHFSSPF